MTKARRLRVYTLVLYHVDTVLHTLTFEYVEGSSVKDVFLKFGLGDGSVVEERIDDIAMQIGQAIAKLHDGGLIHGDLTTSNLLIRASTNQLVHINYLEAGADIIITESYQVTIQGFEAKGFSTEESEALHRKSVEIACEARDAYYDRCTQCSSADSANCRILQPRPILVAVSVGSYGAYLADGSEYSGDYGEATTLGSLKDFHRRRVQVLAEPGPDLLAFETVPNKLEAQAYAELLEEENMQLPAWFSFNSKYGINVVSGDSLLECAPVAESCKKVVAVGINCTPPRFIHGLLTLITQVATKPIIVYPNSGESHGADRMMWVVSEVSMVVLCFRYNYLPKYCCYLEDETSAGNLQL